MGKPEIISIAIKKDMPWYDYKKKIIDYLEMEKFSSKYGWTPDQFIIVKSGSAKGATSKGLAEFLEGQDEDHYLVYKFTLQKREEKAA